MISHGYQVGGSLTSDAPSYVEREADEELYQSLKFADFCYVLNSRQMGKSSLLLRTRYRLEQEGFKCTTVDMTNIGSEYITPSQWYKGLVGELWSGFNLVKKINLKAWWQEQEDISLVQRLSRFISDVLLVEFPKERLFIFIDEIDSILNLDFSVDDFFALIRFCYNQRGNNPEFKRITFAIFGVTIPSDLIKNKKRTIFNIGKAIELRGLTLEKIQPLVQGLEVKFANAQAIIKEILTLTSGQPFLTQKICQLVLDSSPKPIDSNFKITLNEADWVRNIVNLRIIERWEFQDEPEHLQTIRNRLLSNEAIAVYLLGVYQQILQGDDILADNSREEIKLILSGLVINEQGKLKVKNKIYQEVFNLEWVAQQMENLRPYAKNIKVWIACNQQDNSQLLQGAMLQQALDWAFNKRLSDIDYRFLAASQELAKRELESDLAAEKQARKIEQEKAKFALQAAQKAHQILGMARKNAKCNAKKIRLSKSWIAGITSTVTFALILVYFTGILQGMEWTILDRFFQARPPSGMDSRIVIITIDETDIQQIGHYPLSDNVLGKAIETLKNYKPSVIGLDLYRDLPVEPGYQKLVQIFKNTPNLIGIEKVVGSKVPAPPILAGLGQVGLADQVLDGDGKVRRALLSIRMENSEVRLNMGLQLALYYLKNLGITPQPKISNPYEINLGKAKIVPLDSWDGGYVGGDMGGYQILLNFHGTKEHFQTFSIKDLLANKIKPESLINRVVLIGVIAESVNDFFQTPYSSSIFEHPKHMAGVTIHANITSQILSAALDGRPILRTFPKFWEWLWILLFSGIGATLTWLWKSPKITITLIAIAILGLVVITYLAFLMGWWIPIVSPITALIFAATTLSIITSQRLEKIRLCQTVQLLSAMLQEEPAAGQIAIEYLKQAESQENQALIEQIINSQQIQQ
ncbi:MAG: CHASE2 domain-containing protein [Scytonematopsis contorta HA4267-MV1]|jgi:CHASE2 domain-containing sensor protein|nr:CHASE2 domain-containing protein [Scytonematopsis contorta HA4267-MV1]